MPLLEKSSSPSIALISSVSGFEVDFAAGSYGAIKAAAIHYTTTQAAMYAKDLVRVNCIAPGAVMTPMLAGVPDQIREKITAQIPVGRIAEPREIAAVHAFLASDEAAFITGQVIFVDGGMSVGV